MFGTASLHRKIMHWTLTLSLANDSAKSGGVHEDGSWHPRSESDGDPVSTISRARVPSGRGVATGHLFCSARQSQSRGLIGDSETVLPIRPSVRARYQMPRPNPARIRMLNRDMSGFEKVNFGGSGQLLKVKGRHRGKRRDWTMPSWGMGCGMSRVWNNETRGFL